MLLERVAKTVGKMGVAHIMAELGSALMRDDVIRTLINFVTGELRLRIAE